MHETEIRKKTAAEEKSGQTETTESGYKTSKEPTGCKTNSGSQKNTEKPLTANALHLESAAFFEREADRE